MTPKTPFETFLNLCDKDDLTSLLQAYDLPMQGTKETLINRLVSAKLHRLDLTISSLLGRHYKFSIQSWCKKLKLKTTGTKEDMLERIIENLILPEESLKKHYHIEQIDNNGQLLLENVDIPYLLERFYSTDELKKICRMNNLQISGNKIDMIERIVKKREIKIVDILNRLHEDDLDELCEDMDIDAEDLSKKEMMQNIAEVIQTQTFPIFHQPERTARSEKSYKYDVTLSFAGEDRIHMELILRELKKRNLRIFYDKDEDLWGKDLYSHLSHVYGKEARFCIMLLSKHYATKLWTNHERKAAQARAFQENEEYILPVRLDDTEIEGIPSTIGYIDFNKTPPGQIAEMVVNKLNG